MTAGQPAPVGIQPPLMTVHALGIAVGQLDEHTAQIVLHNPAVHAAAQLNAEALRALGERMIALAEVLTDPPAELHLPQGAGRLLGPDGGVL